MLFEIRIVSTHERPALSAYCMLNTPLPFVRNATRRMRSSQNPCVELPLVVGLVGQQRDELRVQGFTAGPVYGRAKCLPMLGSLKT